MQSGLAALISRNCAIDGVTPAGGPALAAFCEAASIAVGARSSGTDADASDGSVPPPCPLRLLLPRATWFPSLLPG